MNIVRKWYQILTYTNGIIALAAVAQCALTYLIIDIPAHPYILMIEGTSTLLLYNFSLFLSKPALPPSSPYLRTRFFFKHERMMWAISATALLLLLCALTQIHLMTLAFLGFIGVISVLYNTPVLSIGKEKSGLRQLPGLKLFYIAILWSMSTVGLPVVEAWVDGYTIAWPKALFLAMIKILFLIICTLPFDIRDITQDKLYGLRTIPTLIGANRSIRLTYTLLLAHLILCFIAPYNLLLRTGLILTDLCTFFVLKKAFGNSPFYQSNTYLMDVVLILQYAITACLLWFDLVL